MGKGLTLNPFKVKNALNCKMGNSKHSFLKQWFTFTFSDGSTDLLYSCSNNHYIHSWLEERGYSSWINVLNLKDYNLFIQALNESTNMIPDIFEEHFPDNLMKNYTLWNMETGHYWSNVSEYREYCKAEMEKLFERLYEFDDDIEKSNGILEYHIYYGH